MTADALSPPNPAESLRERLIREGKIVPAMDSSLDSLHIAAEELSKLAEDLDKVCLLLDDISLTKARRNYIYENYLKALRYYEDLFHSEESEIGASHSNVVINYFYALSVKHLKVIDCALRDVERFLSNRVSILRSGFFFAFKENMKNTP